jgi:uncharacterized protein (TIGR00369 family)
LLVPINKNIKTPEEANALLKDYLPGFIGIELLDFAPDAVKSRMIVEKHHLAPNGYLHAASVVALADTTCGRATAANMPEGAVSYTTIELKTNFIGTVQEGAICCTATPQHLGRTTQVWDAVVADEATGKTIAIFRNTQMILWPKAE